MFWDEDSKTRVIVAVKDIEANQEICHNYLQNVYDFQSRKIEIYQRWNFHCSCDACVTETDLSIMINLENIRNQIKKKQIVTNLSSVLNSLEENENQIRITKTLKMLDEIYNNICLTDHFSRQIRVTTDQIAAIAVRFTEILFDENNELSKTWIRRNKFKIFSIIMIKLDFMLKKIFIISTYALLILNFHELNISQFILLLISFTIFLKM